MRLLTLLMMLVVSLVAREASANVDLFRTDAAMRQRGETPPRTAESAAPDTRRIHHQDGFGLVLTGGGLYKFVRHGDKIVHGFSLDGGLGVTYRRKWFEQFSEISFGGDVLTGAMEACLLTASLFDLPPRNRARIGPGAMLCMVVEKDQPDRKGGVFIDPAAIVAAQVTVVEHRFEMLIITGILWSRPVSAPAPASNDDAHAPSSRPDGMLLGVGGEFVGP